MTFLIYICNVLIVISISSYNNSNSYFDNKSMKLVASPVISSGGEVAVPEKILKDFIPETQLFQTKVFSDLKKL